MRKIDKVLFNAVYESNIEKILFALNEGANVNSKNKWNSTPLHQACIFQKADVVRLLIKQGAELHAMNTFRRTPLSLIPHNSECANILKEFGAIK